MKALLIGKMEEEKMRKKVLFLCTLYIASLSLILTGCKNDEPEQPAKVQTYHVSIQAGKGDANQQNGPRKALGLNGTTLTASWAAGEQVSVRNLTKNADLEGNLAADSAGVQTVLAGDLTGTINAGDALELTFLSPDYANQAGTLDYIAANCDYAVATIHVASVTWGSITFDEGITEFENRQAITKFTLMNEAKDAALNASKLEVEVDGTTYTVTPASATSDIFVALPGFTDKTIKLTATVGSDTYTFTSPTISFEDGKYYVITVGLKPKQVLDLPFAVSDTKSVYFAKGNLQYNDALKKWRIAENQYDFVGSYYTAILFAGTYCWYEFQEIGNVYDGGVKCNNTVFRDPTVEIESDVMRSDCWIDQFGWNTYNKPLLVSTSRYDYASTQEDFHDWGENEIYDGDVKRPANYWRTLTEDEWMYLIGRRPNAENLCAYASINLPTYGRVNGLILLPDGFEKPSDVPFYNITNSANAYPLVKTPDGSYQGDGTHPNDVLEKPANIEEDGVFMATLNEALESDLFMYNQNRYTLEQWEKLEAAGAVFLPAAGWIESWWTDIYGEDYVAFPFQLYGNFTGAYWSSTLGYSQASYLLMQFEGNGHKLGTGTNPLYTGCSVRLVRDL